MKRRIHGAYDHTETLKLKQVQRVHQAGGRTWKLMSPNKLAEVR
jgi:hypothetical protein